MIGLHKKEKPYHVEG
ncbi:Protein of unknown function [Bacillus cereus]|nr:Protein of unknown function [Bacillus cereus]